ncbi:MAG TPA: DNA repair exonuclease [Acetivibrio sp.]|nr:DNA repair exonuclease [Clostridium sp.]HQA56558.1 DNA repair exonuclease [Acetivibrio sp.]
MNSLKFLHFSDLHLDAPFSSLGDVLKVREQRRKDLYDVFDGIINLAKREAVDLILISGDLYEHYYSKNTSIHYINRKFEEIPGIKVFIVPGNHDPNAQNSYYNNFEWSKNVYILSKDRPQVYIEDLNTCVYGAGFSSFYENDGVLEGIGSVDKQRINIMLFHGTVDMNFKENRYNPISSKELATYGMDYVALGHFHNRFEKIVDDIPMYNPGSPEPLGFDEEGEHGVYIGRIVYVSEKDKKLEVRFERTSKRQYRTLEIKSDCFFSDEQIADMIISRFEGQEKDNSLVNAVLRGYTGQGYRINAKNVEGILKDRFFYLAIKDETVPLYDYEELIQDPGLMGLFVRKMFSMIDNAKNEKEKYLLMKSLQYGVEALEQGKVEVL